MQYLGEFLSPQNNISKDQDQLTKYFYFRPDKYENPDADLENIFIIRSMDEFPKRLDKLSENPAYAIESIEVSKRVSDEETGVKNVSYVVTATYDLLENISKREDSGGGGGTSSSSDVNVNVDEDGNKIVGQILPWKQRAQWNFQPIELTTPFIMGYVPSGTSWSTPSIPIVNSAGSQLLAETRRYQIEITYQKNYKDPQIWEQINEATINSLPFDLNFDYRGSFPSGTLLMIPPTYSSQWTEVDRLDEYGNTIKDLVRYYSYTVRMIYDAQGHDKKLLNVGTYAKFGNELKPSQIWEVTVADSTTGSLIGEPRWVSAAEALREQATAIKNNRIMSATPITDPVPLAPNGSIDTSAILDPVNRKIGELVFTQYAGMDFGSLPFKN